MFDPIVQSSSNPLDASCNHCCTSFGGNFELTDPLNPDYIRLSGASQGAMSTQSLALDNYESSILPETLLTESLSGMSVAQANSSDHVIDIIRQERGGWMDGIRDAEVYLSDGNWGFNQQLVMPDMSAMNSDFVNLIPGDFNGDGFTDLIRQEKGAWVDGVNDVQILTSRGDGTFNAPIAMNNMDIMNGNVVNLIVGDFTGGGADDIIRQEKGDWLDGINDVEFYTFSNGNFVEVGDVPDMGAMRGDLVALIPGYFGSTSKPATDYKLPLPGNLNWQVSQGLDGMSHNSQKQTALDFSPSGMANVPVLAASSGQVVFTGWQSGGFGNYLILDHDAPYDGSGYLTLYAHLASAPSVATGQSVSQGDVLGIMGTTGYSDATHLHFEVFYNEEKPPSLDTSVYWNPTPVSTPQIQSFRLEGRSIADYDYPNYYLSSNTNWV